MLSKTQYGAADLESGKKQNDDFSLYNNNKKYQIRHDDYDTDFEDEIGEETEKISFATTMKSSRNGASRKREMRGQILNRGRFQKKSYWGRRSCCQKFSIIVFVLFFTCSLVMKTCVSDSWVFNQWAKAVKAAVMDDLSDKDRDLLEAMPKVAQRWTISGSVDDMFRPGHGYTTFDTSDYDDDAGNAATAFGKDMQEEFIRRGIFSEFKHRMDRNGAKSAIPIMHQDFTTARQGCCGRVLYQLIDWFCISKFNQNANLDDPDVVELYEQKSKELKAAGHEVAGEHAEIAAAWLGRDQTTLKERLGDNGLLKWFVMNVWFTRHPSKRLIVMDRFACERAHEKFDDKAAPRYPMSDSFYMKQEVLEWVIKYHPEHVYLTKPGQGIAFWGMGFPVDVLETTPSEAVMGNSRHGIFHSGYVLRHSDMSKASSGEDRYTVTARESYFKTSSGEMFGGIGK